MKERPIIFSTEMVKAILDGRKTQTRRVAKFANHLAESYDHCWVYYDKKQKQWQFKGRSRFSDLIEPFILDCPYGQVGDRLWVRETHFAYGRWVKNGTTKTGKQRWRFKAWYPHTDIEVRFDTPVAYCKDKEDKGWFKRSALFLRKKDARITLEITGERVEKQLDITLEDVIKEGFGEIREFNEAFLRLNPHLKETNPWVWVIKFDNIGIKVK